jgi:hypothetical protein
MIISIYRRRTSLTSLFILLKTLLEMPFTFSIGKSLSGFNLLTNGTIGFFLQLVTAVKKVLELMEVVTNPESLLASSLIASFKTYTPIRGHAKRVKTVSPKVVEVRLPSLSGAIRSQFNLEDGGALRINRD